MAGRCEAISVHKQARSPRPTGGVPLGEQLIRLTKHCKLTVTSVFLSKASSCPLSVSAVDVNQPRLVKVHTVVKGTATVTDALATYANKLA